MARCAKIAHMSVKHGAKDIAAVSALRTLAAR
jgi:hypothetical protein